MIRFKPHGVIASIFVASLLLFASLFLRFPVLYDGDSYFHLAAARLYADGIPDGLEWARFSVMREGWGDKEILFHLFLLPFTMLPDPAVGGRLALAGLNAALLTLLSGLGWRAIGRWGLLIGPLAYLLQPDFLNRAFRLRPELLGVTLLIAMIVLAARRRYLGAALVACAWTLGYTAAQVPAGLALLWVAWERFERGVWNTKLALAVPGGVALGLLVHPHFPKNLEIWWIQNVRFFEFKSRLDVGEEIFAPGLADIVLSNAAIALALGALWLASRPTDAEKEEDSTAAYFTIAAAAFFGLYVLMARMVTWMVPLVVLATVFALARRGRKAESRVRVGSVRVPLAAILVVALVVSLPRIANPALVQSLIHADSILNEAELSRFGARMPDGARVAATWRDGEVYAFYAPGASYLNVLDPIFMAIPHPEAFALQRRVFDGTEPDIPFAIASTLDSNHIAFDRSEMPPILFERVSRDPRFELLHNERNVLAAVRPDDSFIVDWTQTDGSPWPRATGPESGRLLQGYVNLGRPDAGSDCVSVSHDIVLDRRRTLTLNFSPWGTGHLEIDGQRTGDVTSPARAVIGSGARVAADLGEGPHRIDVTSCAAEGSSGFYLRVIQNVEH